MLTRRNHAVHFVPQDFRLDGERTKEALDKAVTAQGIAQEQWQQWFARIPARRSMLLFDTCESGTLTDAERETQTLERGAASDRLAQATGRSILTAASGDTDALEGFRQHGLFTYSVLEALDWSGPTATAMAASTWLSLRPTCMRRSIL
jgi:hypothetical protein